MPKYRVTLDEKNTIWVRYTQDIEADSLEEAQKQFQKEVQAGNVAGDWLIETSEYISKKENYAMSHCDDLLPDDNWEAEADGIYNVVDFVEEENYEL